MASFPKTDSSLPAVPAFNLHRDIYHNSLERRLVVVVSLSTCVTASQSWSVCCACSASPRSPRRGRGWGGQRAWLGCRSRSSAWPPCPAEREIERGVKINLSGVVTTKPAHLYETSRASDVWLEIRGFRQENIEKHDSCCKDCSCSCKNIQNSKIIYCCQENSHPRPKLSRW